jgi:hypothetical protein
MAVDSWLSEHANDDCCDVTTIGRQSGRRLVDRPHATGLVLRRSGVGDRPVGPVMGRESPDALTLGVFALDEMRETTSLIPIEDISRSFRKLELQRMRNRQT